MRIDGRAIAKEILDDLAERVSRLKEKDITPYLAIILVDHGPASEAYVRQKKLKGKSIGAHVAVLRYDSSVTNEQLVATIQQYNNDSNVHGIIVQRPLPAHIDNTIIDRAVDPKKDVDGFHSKSQFEIPIAAAVLHILKYIFQLPTPGVDAQNFQKWLQSKSVTVIGKGKTGGGPIIKSFRTLRVAPLIVDSRTTNSERVTKDTDIVISTVGKPNVVTSSMLKKGVILVSVGLHKGTDGKLHGDYGEDGIKDIASFYTPTPGGVGPVNVAMLLANLILAAENATE